MKGVVVGCVLAGWVASGLGCSTGAGSGAGDEGAIVAATARGAPPTSEPVTRVAGPVGEVPRVGAPSGEVGGRHALVIGIDRYTGVAAPGCADRGWRDLQGAANDAREMAAVLRARGFEVATLIDGEAGDRPPIRANIIAAIDELTARVGRGDVVTFYYAGHGSQIAAPGGLSGADATEPLWETLVPKDSVTACASDISDKELRLKFNKLLDKVGAPDGALTVILDSCHSGSGVRGPGATRSVRPATGKATNPGDFGPTLESRNTIVLSATSKDQLAQESTDEQGIPRGNFTLALARALRDAPADETAERVYRRVSARMGSRSQTPSMSPPDSKRVLFGKSMAPRATSVIAKKVPGGKIGVDAGRAIGLLPGSRLARRGDTTRAEIRVARAELAYAEIEGAGAGAVQPGDELEILSWASDASFRVHVPARPPGRDVLLGLASELEAIRKAGITLVEDPTTTRRTHLVWYERGAWMLVGPASTTAPISLGERLDGKVVARHVKADASTGARALYVALPPPAELVTSLALGGRDPRSVLAQVDRLDGAQYALTSRLVQGRLEVAWIAADFAPRAEPEVAVWGGFFGVRLAAAGPASAKSSAPARTRWVAAEPDRKHEIIELAERLRFVSAWLTMSSPADGSGFPYSLAFRPKVADRPPEDKLRGWTIPAAVDYGTQWELGLVPRPEVTKRAEREVHVFVVAEDASGCWLYPREGGSARYPRKDEPFEAVVLDVDDDDAIDIGAPCGRDTYVMVTSEVGLPLYRAFESIGLDPETDCWPGVTARAAGRGDPLEALLEEAVFGQRAGFTKRASGAWGVERIVVPSRGCPAR